MKPKNQAIRVFGNAPAAAVGFQTLPDVFDGGEDGNQKQNPQPRQRKRPGEIVQRQCRTPWREQNLTEPRP
jgi:hypothetical protein